jgi:hypothetical protein
MREWMQGLPVGARFPATLLFTYLSPEQRVGIEQGSFAFPRLLSFFANISQRTSILFQVVSKPKLLGYDSE